MNKTKVISLRQDYLVLNKPIGFLSQKPQNREEDSIFEIDKLSGKNAHVLTRLDRPVSGLVLVSLNKRFNNHFQKEQTAGKVIKTYIAVVEGKNLELPSSIENYLFHNKKSFKSYISDEPNKEFKKVKLDIAVVSELENYTILKLKINKGKFHQIRAQLAHLSCPVKGDVKYKARRKNKDRSIHLHCYEIEFQDLQGNLKRIKAELPKNDNLWQVVDNHIQTE